LPRVLPTAGAIFGLGHAFVANMNGNTVMLGIAVFLYGNLLQPGISLLCYAAGAALAAEECEPREMVG
jgi:uncharacterized membrane protein YoaK (UPF0700 family)